MTATTVELNGICPFNQLDEYDRVRGAIAQTIRDVIEASRASKWAAEYGGGAIIVSPSAKEPGLTQLTYYIAGDPVSDAQVSDSEAIIERIIQYRASLRDVIF